MKVSDDIKISPSACTFCGKELDAATCVGESGKVRPKPGDITTCMYCGHLMSFDDNLRMRELTDAEMLEIAGDPRVLAISEAINKLKLNKKSKDG